MSKSSYFPRFFAKRSIPGSSVCECLLISRDRPRLRAKGRPGPWPELEVVLQVLFTIIHTVWRSMLFIVARLRSSLTPGSFRDCKLETPLRKRRSRVSITNEFSVKRQRVSEAIGSIDVSTNAEQRQEYADINAEPLCLCSSCFRN